MIRAVVDTGKLASDLPPLGMVTDNFGPNQQMPTGVLKAPMRNSTGKQWNVGAVERARQESTEMVNCARRRVAIYSNLAKTSWRQRNMSGVVLE